MLFAFYKDSRKEYESIGGITRWIFYDIFLPFCPILQASAGMIKMLFIYEVKILSFNK